MVCHLSRRMIAHTLDLPTPRRRTSSPPAGIRGISPQRVYPISLQPHCTCFLLHWSATPSSRTGVTRFVALRRPDFPLSQKNATATNRPAQHKISVYIPVLTTALFGCRFAPKTGHLPSFEGGRWGANSWRRLRLGQMLGTR